MLLLSNVLFVLGGTLLDFILTSLQLILRPMVHLNVSPTVRAYRLSFAFVLRVHRIYSEKAENVLFV